MLEIYIVVCGCILCIIGTAELIWPYHAYDLWRKWVKQKLFFLHGLVLIIGGFPLTIYNGPLSAVIFIFGIIVVLIGPFILLYPEKIRLTFEAVDREIDIRSTKKILIAEAFIKISIGVICAVSFLLNQHL